MDCEAESQKDGIALKFQSKAVSADWKPKHGPSINQMVRVNNSLFGLVVASFGRVQLLAGFEFLDYLIYIFLVQASQIGHFFCAQWSGFLLEYSQYIALLVHLIRSSQQIFASIYRF